MQQRSHARRPNLVTARLSPGSQILTLLTILTTPTISGCAATTSAAPQKSPYSADSKPPRSTTSNTTPRRVNKPPDSAINAPATPVKPAAPPLVRARPFTVVAVGDMMLGTTYPDKTGGALPPNDGAELLAAVTPLLSSADIAFGNLEGPLFDGEGSGKCSRMKKRTHGKQTCWAFRMPTRYAKLLVAAGFDVVSIANNHALDFGAEGRESTQRALAAVGLAQSGAPGSVAKVTAGGVKIGVIAFATANHSHNLNDIDAAVAAVKRADATFDLVIVSFHGGAEGRRHQHVPHGPETFYGEARGDLRKFSRAVIDAGADLVIGHGPHVVRGMEIYRGRLIAYSLGNFATYRGISVRGPAGVTVMLEATLSPDGRFLSGRLHSVAQRRPAGPAPDPTNAAIAQVRNLSLADFPDSGLVIGADGALTVAAPASSNAAGSTAARTATSANSTQP